jgi:hypothetical protein
VAIKDCHQDRFVDMHISRWPVPLGLQEAHRQTALVWHEAATSYFMIIAIGNVVKVISLSKDVGTGDEKTKLHIKKITIRLPN